MKSAAHLLLFFSKKIEKMNKLKMKWKEYHWNWFTWSGEANFNYCGQYGYDQYSCKESSISYWKEENTQAPKKIDEKFWNFPKK